MDQDLVALRAHARAGRAADAEQVARDLLARDPDCVEALRLLAGAAFARSDAATAIALLSRAANAEPHNPGIPLELGLAYRAAERFDAARYVLERAVELGRGDPTPRLLLANVLELDQRRDVALLHYFRAIIEARQAGRWNGDADTDPSLRELVAHARRFAIDGRRAMLLRSFEERRAAEPQARWDRVEAALAIYLGERAAAPADPRQQPGFMFVPGIETGPFIAAGRFAWAVADGVAPLLALGEEPGACLAAATPRADGIATAPLLVRGVARASLRRAAPRLHAALAALPLARVLNHGPDSELISLAAGARARGKTGGANSRCRIVVNLVDSAPLVVDVAGESRALDPGRHLAIDPCFAHAYACAGPGVARLLWFDVSHPDLATGEQQAIADLIERAVDFETRVMDLP